MIQIEEIFISKKPSVFYIIYGKNLIPIFIHENDKYVTIKLDTKDG